MLSTMMVEKRRRRLKKEVRSVVSREGNEAKV
jgi:hypothetical protein